MRARWSPSPSLEPASVCSSILPRICSLRDQALDSPRGGINGYLGGSEPTSPPGACSSPPQLYLAESGPIKAEGCSREHHFLAQPPPSLHCLKLRITSLPKTVYPST